MTIGDVNDACAEARRLQTQVDQGMDPRQEKAERIAATEAKRGEARRVEAPALEAWGAYLEARKANWSVSQLADHENVSKEGASCAPEGARRARVTRPFPVRSAPRWRSPSPRSTPTRCGRGWMRKQRSG